MKASTNFLIGKVETDVGPIKQVSSNISARDRWEHTMVRLGISRMKYKVQPGLYALGLPSPESPVMVSANYKLSFDILRKALNGMDAWILVLDTRGINVWCAAGKGTFGTSGLARRIKLTKLLQIVSHRKVIVPQLGATGVAAHEVKKLCGFSVQYGPVRAADIPKYLANSNRATPEMRRVHFTVTDRLTLVPLEVVTGFSKLMMVILSFLLLSGIKPGGYALQGVVDIGLPSAFNLLLAFISGTILAPLLLPWLPARSFSIKGAYAGVVVFGFAFLIRFTGKQFLEHMAWFLIIVAISSFITLNVTGSSTYTSLSGVRKEMKIAIPFQVSAAVIGVGLWLASRLI
jgi:acetyl-CoA decarbonylase/synthase complex subunit gamma